MSSMTCDTGCGTFFMSGREYYNISGKSYEGHNPVCPYRKNTPYSTPLVPSSIHSFNT